MNKIWPYKLNSPTSNQPLIYLFLYPHTTLNGLISMLELKSVILSKLNSVRLSWDDPNVYI